VTFVYVGGAAMVEGLARLAAPTACDLRGHGALLFDMLTRPGGLFGGVRLLSGMPAGFVV
jgi:hypothetical protein